MKFNKFDAVFNRVSISPVSFRSAAFNLKKNHKNGEKERFLPGKDQKNHSSCSQYDNNVILFINYLYDENLYQQKLIYPQFVLVL